MSELKRLQEENQRLKETISEKDKLIKELQEEERVANLAFDTLGWAYLDRWPLRMALSEYYIRDVDILQRVEDIYGEDYTKTPYINKFIYASNGVNGRKLHRENREVYGRKWY